MMFVTLSYIAAALVMGWTTWTSYSCWKAARLRRPRAKDDAGKKAGKTRQK